MSGTDLEVRHSARNYRPLPVEITRGKGVYLFNPGDHGSTFGGNPLAAAVGLASLEILVRDRLAEHAAAMGARARSPASGRSSAKPSLRSAAWAS